MSEHQIQANIGEAPSLSATAMPGEVLIVHMPDPSKSSITLLNQIRETRFCKVIAVGAGKGRFKAAPVAVGDIVVTKTATAGVAVGNLHHENRRVHRLEWAEIIAVAEDYQ